MVIQLLNEVNYKIQVTLDVKKLCHILDKLNGII